MRSLIMVLFFTLWSSMCLASSSGVLVGLGFLRFQTETEGPQIGTGESTENYVDWKIGYLPGNDLYIGAIYSTYVRNDGSSDELKRNLLGLTLGFHRGGWFLDGSYFVDGRREYSTTALQKASGYGLDFGYQHMVNSNVYLGVEGSYKSFTYKEYSTSGVTTKVDNKVKTEFYPLLLLGMIF